MPTPALIPQPRLRGYSVFLSASVPSPDRSEEFRRVPEAADRIDEAVNCVARAIFAEGGTLVFGAHPSISPMVARVLQSYVLPASEEVAGDVTPHTIEALQTAHSPSLVMYQSKVWEPFWVEASKSLSLQQGVSLKWTPVIAGEFIDLSMKEKPQAPQSMGNMRTSMIDQTDPIAMIAIGGMEGIFAEARIFAAHCPDRPIFALATTGGASALLEQKEEYGHRVRVMDANALALVQKFWTQKEGGSPREFFVPYALVAQQIVTEILQSLPK